MNTKLIIKNIPQSRYEAACYLQKLGLIIVPCAPKDKRPLIKGWQKLDYMGPSQEDLIKYFKRGKSNIGWVLRGCIIIVDFDAKKDGGKSAREFLEQHPEMCEGPIEQTANGFHIPIMCPDIPSDAEGNPVKARITKQIHEMLSIDVLCQGTQCITAPSIHPSGVTYTWVQEGEVPVKTWAQLKTIFGSLSDPVIQSTVSSKEESAPVIWYDLAAIAKQLGLYLKDLGDGSHEITCPWCREHSDGNVLAGIVQPSGLFVAYGFHCFHAHCAGRTLKDFLEYAIKQQINIEEYILLRGSGDGRPRVLLPKAPYPVSAFTKKVGEILAKTGKYYSYQGALVYLKPIPPSGKKQICYVKANEAVSLFEEDIEFGILDQSEADSHERLFIVKSMNTTQAQQLLDSNQFVEVLPRLDALLTTPLPCMVDDNIVLPGQGYDTATHTYVDSDLKIDTEMPVSEAIDVLQDILCDFPFKDELSGVLAVAYLLTGFCRLLLPQGARTPLWVFFANREGAGKDCLQSIMPHIVEGGDGGTYPPITKDESELRKKILTALRENKSTMHFGNCKGELNSSALESAITSPVWTDRLLGVSKELTLLNNIIYSVSCNAGVEWTPDLQRRARIITLHVEEEDLSKRSYKYPNLQEHIHQNRGTYLAALYALLREWDNQGRPEPSSHIPSFIDWSKVIGGIIEVNGANPCTAQTNPLGVGGDSVTEDMKNLFEICEARCSQKMTSLSKLDIYNLIGGENGNGGDVFQYMDLAGNHGDQTKLGKLIKKYENRVLNDIKLTFDYNDKRRPRFLFQKVQEG